MSTGYLLGIENAPGSVLDLTNGEMKNIAPMSVGRFPGAGLVSCKGLLYVVGGWDENDVPLKSMESYN